MPTNNLFGQSVKRIHEALEKWSNNALRSQNLTMAQLAALVWLNELPDKKASLKELERMLHASQSSTARIIDRLEEKDFVESFSDPNDKRIKIVNLTQKGMHYCLAARENMSDVEQSILSCLSETERDTLIRLMIKINDSLDSH